MIVSTATATFVALGTAFLGAVTNTLGAVYGAGTEIAPWAQVGGTATAVGALAYVAKLLADGKLVAVPVADLIRTSDKRDDALKDLLEDARQREDALRALLMAKGINK